MLKHLRYRPSLAAGLAVYLCTFALALSRLRPTTAALVGWDSGVVAYGLVLCVVVRHRSVERMKAVASELDAGRQTMLLLTLAASVASLGAIVAELARVHGRAHAGWIEALAGATVILSWFFVHTVFATHYAHEFWHRGGGLSFLGNDRPNYGEFLYFSFCMAVASQVSDVSTQSAGMRRLVLVHSLAAYLFNTAIIALGVNIAASLAS